MQPTPGAREEPVLRERPPRRSSWERPPQPRRCTLGETPEQTLSLWQSGGSRGDQTPGAADHTPGALEWSALEGLKRWSADRHCETVVK